MLDVAEVLTAQDIPYAVVGAMAAAVHGVVRASVDADAVLRMQVGEAARLREVFRDSGYQADLRIGDADDPIPALLEITDPHGNRVDLLIGLRGMEPSALERAREVMLMGCPLRVIGREDFIAMKAFAGGPLDLADARAVIELDRPGLDLALLRRLAVRFGHDASRNIESLLGGVD